VQELTAWLVSGTAQLLLRGPHDSGCEQQKAQQDKQDMQLQPEWRQWLQHSLLRCKQQWGKSRETKGSSNSSSGGGVQEQAADGAGGLSVLLQQLLREVQQIVSGGSKDA
jgi:hypothetical protein